MWTSCLCQMLPGQWGTSSTREKDLGSGVWVGGPVSYQQGHLWHCNKTEDRDHGYLDGGAKISQWKTQNSQKCIECPREKKSTLGNYMTGSTLNPSPMIPVGVGCCHILPNKCWVCQCLCKVPRQHLVFSAHIASWTLPEIRWSDVGVIPSYRWGNWVTGGPPLVNR